MDTLMTCTARPPDGGSAWTAVPNLKAHGGHAANCAHAVARAGCAGAVLGVVGADAAARELTDELAAGGDVDVSSVRSVASACTGQVAVLRFGDESFMVMDRGANDALTVDDVEQAIVHHRPRVTVVMDVPAHTFAGTVRAARRAGAVVCAPGGRLAADATVLADVGHADWVVLNESERRAAGAVTDVTGLSEQVGVITTLGAAGVELLEGGRRRRLPAAPVRAGALSLGAGDAFIGGFAAGLRDGLGVEGLIAAGQRSALGVMDEESARPVARTSRRKDPS